MKNLRLQVVGGGNMGAALVAGLVRSKRVPPSRIVVTDVRADSLKSLRARYGVRTSTDNTSTARQSNVVLLCVKPQQMDAVLAELRPAVRPGQLFLSVAAGVRTERIEKGLGGRAPVIRVMPNTPALYGAGALVYCLGRRANSSHEAVAKAILAPAGEVWKTGEKDLDAVTALSGSGPAYVFYLAECLTEAGRRMGLSPRLAEALARQTVHGAGLMLKQSAEPAGLLRERVTSPGGTTAAAMAVLEKARVRKIFEKALRRARDRSRELSGGR